MRPFASPALLTLALLMSPHPGFAADTVDLVFEPPQVDASDICKSRVPDDQLAAMWEQWDGTALPDRDPDILQRELKRLLETDPMRWAKTLERAFELMPAADPGYGADKALLDRIALLLATGRANEVANLRLIDKLRQSDLGSSPRMQSAAAQYLLDGIGTEQDREAGLDLLVKAAYGGNADALLDLTAMVMEGQTIPGWDVPPDLAVTMAFGALVGQLDPVICDRAGRIAREYMNGTIVTRDVDLAERWYRFAADLGDAGAAWKVAELHLRSEDVVKDNAVLVTYLQKAADGGLPYAQTTLGRAYELGTLVPRDMERALALHTTAASTGDRGGLVRQTLFLFNLAQKDDSAQPAYRAALERLAGRKDAPSWALVSLADEMLRDQGRWAGEQAAVVLLERAKEMGDSDALERLNAIRFRHVTTEAEFYATVDDVIATIHNTGAIDPMADLQNAFLCRSPSAPHRDEAAYWRGVEEATGSRTVEFDTDELNDLALDPDPLMLAKLQSQALYGRPTAMAQYLAVLDRADAPKAERAFWADYATRFDKVQLSAARLEQEFAQDADERKVDIAPYRAAVAAGDTGAGTELAMHLLDVAKPTAEARVEALMALLPLAQNGNGEAMILLAKADPNRWPNSAAVYRDFAPVIDARGDFFALMLALPHLKDAAQQADYQRRAVAATDCSFDQAITFVDALGAIKDDDAFRRWIEIAEYLGEGDGWRLTRLGDSLIRYGSASDAERAVGYFEVSMNAGSNTAIHRLLRYFARSELPSYDPERSTALYVELIKRSRPVELPRTLARLANEEDEIREATMRAIDVGALYRAAAEAGSPVGMREYAHILQAAATRPEDVAQATDWLRQAAEGGDVEGMVQYAQALSLGIGTEPSREMAIEWLSRAAAKGSEEAEETMKNLNMSSGLSQ